MKNDLTPNLRLGELAVIGIVTGILGTLAAIASANTSMCDEDRQEQSGATFTTFDEGAR